MRSDCIFCKIVKGDVPSYKVYEGDDVLVILDRFPRSEGECLVLTKEHYDNLFDLPPGLGAKIFDAAQRAANKIRETYPIDGLNLIQNNGETAGQQINHFHVHVLPRRDLDSIVIQGKALDVSDEALGDAAEKLKFE